MSSTEIFALLSASDQDVKKLLMSGKSASTLSKLVGGTDSIWFV